MHDRLVALLREHGVEYTVIDHAPEGRTEIVSAMRGHPLSNAAKCMILLVLAQPHMVFNAARLDRSFVLQPEDYRRVARPRVASIAARTMEAGY